MILPEATRIERVVYLTKLFIVRKELTTKEAAAMTDVTQRTIQTICSKTIPLLLYLLCNKTYPQLRPKKLHLCNQYQTIVT